ncbi:MAG TPA: TetR/AcrR family transcriptional regulator [Candidatus Anoxymicrobiaceae bacterium]|jgi:AcrR family transcriptional regulator
MGNGPRYEQIILSSIDVFSRTNYEKATTALLAGEAGIAEGTLYKYFPSKKELFLACYRYTEELLLDRYRKIYKEQGDDTVAYLQAVAHSYLEFVVENPNMRKFIAFILNNSFDDDFKSELERFVKLNVDATERMIQVGIEKGQVLPGVDARAAAWMFVGGYFTLIMMAEIGATEALGNRYLDNLFKFFIVNN